MGSRRKREGGLNPAVAFLTISTGRISGSFLLAVSSYSSTRVPALIPSTALGVLLVTFAALLAYAGFRKSLHATPLVVSFSLSVSALWWGIGLIQIMVGQGVLTSAEDLRNAMMPGLAAFTMGMFIIGVVGVLQDGVPVALMAFAISYSSIHGMAMYSDSTLGSSAVACNYLIVTIVSLYLVAARALYFFSKQRIALPGAELPNPKAKWSGQAIAPKRNDVVVIGLIVNIVSASVFGCRAVGLTTSLFVGQVPWLGMSAFFQLGVCILSYRSFDNLTATFFGFSSVLRFAEGYSLLYRFWRSEEPIFPIPFLVVFAILFLVLALFMAEKSLADVAYLLLFAAYCVAVACYPNGVFHSSSQGVSVAIYVASALMALAKLYNMKANAKIPMGEGIVKNLLTHLGPFRLRQGKDPHILHTGYSKYADGEVLGHACSVLAAFAITTGVDPRDPRGTVVLPWLVVAGGVLKIVCGLVAFSRGKTLESSIFILHGFMWILWGPTRYGGLCGPARGLRVALGIICFMLLNGFLVFFTLFLSIAWFLYCLTFELIIISFLLDAIDALPVGYDIAATIIVGTVSFYCFLSGLINSTFERPQLPMGGPIVKLQGFGVGSTTCLHLPARRTTSTRKIAGILRNGGVCRIPSDDGYALVAACNQPVAVERVCTTAWLPQRSSLEMWVSNLSQLEPLRCLVEGQLWEVMQTTLAFSGKLLICKGVWLDSFAMGEAAEYMGAAQNIALRIPDCAITTHVIELVGPILALPASPTGEADTRRCNHFCVQLGDQVDGVLCDGPCMESFSGITVDCTDISNGNISVSGNGTVPASQVQQVLEEIQRRHARQPATSSSTADPIGQIDRQQASRIHQRTAGSGPPWHVNAGFSSIEDEHL